MGEEGSEGKASGEGRAEAEVEGAGLGALEPLGPRPGRATPRVWRTGGDAGSSSLSMGGGEEGLDGSLTPIGAADHVGFE